MCRTLGRLMRGLTLLVGLPAGGVALYWLATIPDVSGLATTNPSSTALMETRMAEAREQDRSDQPDWTWVPLSYISPYLQRAVIVAEDASFYQHKGFDWEGIKDAAVRNFEQGKLQRGAAPSPSNWRRTCISPPKRTCCGRSPRP